MNASPAIVNTAYPRRTVNSTMIGPNTFGRISANMTYKRFSPRSSAART